VRQNCEREVEKRKTTNPQRTTEEERILGTYGTYFEEIEPQVRAAVLEFYRKGYPTMQSGFYGDKPEFQMMQGHFKLDPETKQKLKALGVEVAEEESWVYKAAEAAGTDISIIPPEAKQMTTIRFRSQAADLQVIEAKWIEIAELLPDRGAPAVDWYTANNIR